MIRVSICFLLFGFVGYAAPLSIDSRLSFEGQPNGTLVDTVRLQNAVEGSIITSWTLSGSGASNYFWFSSTSPYNLSNSWTISGVNTNATDTGTNSLAIYCNQTANLVVQGNFGSNLTNFTFGFAYENNITANDFDSWDLIKFNNGSQDAVINYHTGSPVGYRLHTGSPSLVGSELSVAGHTRTWHTGVFDASPTVTNFWDQIWDLDTKELLGTISIQLTGGSYNPIADVRISNDGHGAAKAKTNYLDNFLMVSGTNSYPIMPWNTNYFYVSKSGNDSNSGRSSSSPWLTIQKAVNSTKTNDTIFISDGTYDEQVTFTNGGGSGSLRRLIAQSTNVICRNFVLTDVRANYNQLVGMSFTAIGANTNVTPIVLNDVTGNQVIDCYFYNTGHGTSGGEGGAIRTGNYTNQVIRGCTIVNSGKNGSTGTPTNAKDFADSNSKTNGQNLLVEYINQSHSSEYGDWTGTNILLRHFHSGPIDSGDWGGTPHIDVVQANQPIDALWLEDIWHDENPTDDSHCILVQYGYAHHITVKRVVSRRSGDRQAFWYGLDSGPTTNIYHLNNTIMETAVGPGRGVNSGTPVYLNNVSNVWAFNNVYSNVTTSANPYQLGTAGLLTQRSNDVMYPQGTPDAGILITNPTWVSYSGNDFRPQSTSALRDGGKGYTTTTGSGSGSTSVTVADSWMFHDGLGLTRGSAIYVGSNNNLYVTGIDHSTHTITVNTAISWSSGDWVGPAYLGNSPDIGAYEYGDTLLDGGTISSNSSVFKTWTVTPSGDARMVIFYVNGIPQTPVFDSPFTYTQSANEIPSKAELYSLRPQYTMSFTATEGAAPASTVFYASATGSMSNDGLTPATPWTLAGTITNSVQVTNGVTVYVMGTNTGPFVLDQRMRGTAAGYITFKSYPSKWSAVINGSATHGFIGSSSGGSEAQYIIVDGLHIQGNAQDGTGGNNHWIITNCWIEGNGFQGIDFSSPTAGTNQAWANLIENNGTNTGSPGHYHGIYVAGQSNAIVDNVSRRNGSGAGIQLYTEDPGVKNWNNYIGQNLTYGHTNLYGAVIWNGNEDAGGHLPGTNYIIGNTFIDGYNPAYGTAYVSNNIIFPNPINPTLPIAASGGGRAPTVVANYNLSSVTLTPAGANDVTGTMANQFVSTNTGLFWLKSSAGARNAAKTDVAAAVDWFGRSQSSVLDIGAVQYSVGAANDTRTLDPSPSAGADYWLDLNSGASTRRGSLKIKRGGSF